MHQWIISLISLLRLLISSFRLECFCLFSRWDSPTCLSLRSFLAMLNRSFPSWHVSAHSLLSSTIGNNLSCYRSLIHGLSLQSLSPSHFMPTSFPPFPDATPWLSSISRSVCSLQIICLYRRTRIPPFHSTNSYYRVSFNILCLSIYKSINLLLILIISSLNHNLFHQILVLMACSGFLFRTSIILLIYEYLSLPKFLLCITSTILFPFILRSYRNLAFVS